MLHTESLTSGEWTFTKTEHHILKSNGEDRERFESELKPLPEIPEMTFDKNVLRVEHKEGYGIEFNALDALKLVNPSQDMMKVSYAEDWKSTRSDQENINHIAKPFDWTYSTNYKGTFINNGEKRLTVAPTEEQIDYQKLKQEEKILFFASFLIFEDELADNGASILSLKFRAMPSGYFILLRFYLRVDNVMVRIYDTRIHCDYSNPHLLREFSVRECPFSQIGHVPPIIMCDPMQAADYIPLVSKATDKLIIPAS